MTKMANDEHTVFVDEKSHDNNNMYARAHEAITLAETKQEGIILIAPGVDPSTGEEGTIMITSIDNGHVLVNILRHMADTIEEAINGDMHRIDN